MGGEDSSWMRKLVTPSSEDSDQSVADTEAREGFKEKQGGDISVLV
jgi:hypothetical protein